MINRKFCAELLNVDRFSGYIHMGGVRINMIPKKIHYCWFGNGEKPELALKCIESWKTHCPDYELVEWNERNFDISAAPLYVRQAYENRKWAFITDYVRLYAMVNYGGVYMDTDVEVIKNIDEFLDNRAFSGFEDGVNIPTGIMASEKDFPLFQKLLDYYNDVNFENEDGTLNTITNVTIITGICEKNGLIKNNKFQIIDGFALYPKDYFCPIDYDSGKLKKTKNTYTIHWFAGSWRSKEEQEQMEKWRKIRKFDGIIHFPNRVLSSVLGEEKYEKLKSKVKKK